MTPYSLTELSLCISDAIQFELDDTYWVRAEIASLSQRGHCYMELVEKADNSTIQAKMRATCWSHTYQLLAPYFAAETGQTLAPGMQVLLQVEVHYHAVYGLSLNIIDIDPTFTLGALALQRQQTILRLQQDGVMDMQRHLPLPSLPRRIAVISAEDAAGYGDFCHQLSNNAHGFLFHTQLFPAVMQGDQSPASIISALQTIAHQSEDFDIVVIVRGGGATTDLRSFDDYSLASHCAQFPLPIIAGIGHTRDTSIVDMVVHTSVKTPTAAAEMLINCFLRQAERLQSLQLRLQQMVQSAVQRETHHLQSLLHRMEYSVFRRVQQQRQHLQLLERTIDLHSPERIYRMGYSLTTVNGRIVRSVHDVQPGDQLLTHTSDGTIQSQVSNNTNHLPPTDCTDNYISH